ncbi:hypothetical protein Scep_006555 [Stephania cephalantha]|uniref:CASP-like protein n=1 Tax=Stephania cephalantha TaxID=152367 RepID=A0AAP0K9X3_9MAGN
MAGVTPVVCSPALPTPSPFAFSVASTGLWSSRPTIRLLNLILRLFALLFSFVSALSLSSKDRKGSNPGSSFGDYPELWYCFAVAILVSIYSAFQLFKGVCDIAYRGVLISDKTSDYISFVFDQVSAYLLVSSSSVSALAIRELGRTHRSTELRKMTIVSVTMSIAAFFVIVASSVFSGYKLCKRIW